jgi:hypothetical protein
VRARPIHRADLASSASGGVALLFDSRLEKSACYGTADPNPRYSEKDGTMRKVIELLDDEQRAALREWADFGTAVFSSALAVTVLKSIVGLFI